MRSVESIQKSPDFSLVHGPVKEFRTSITFAQDFDYYKEIKIKEMCFMYFICISSIFTLFCGEILKVAKLDFEKIVSLLEPGLILNTPCLFFFFS